MHCGLPAGLDEACIERLETGFLDGLIAGNSGFPNNQECGNSSGFFGAACRPDFDDGFQEGFEEFAEAEEIGNKLQGGVEEKLLGGGVGKKREKVHQRLRVRFEERGQGAEFLCVGCNAAAAGGSCC